MYLLPVRFKRIEADLVSVWQTASEGTGELYELDHQEEDAQDGVDLGDAGLPEGEVGCQILCWNCQDLQTQLAMKRRGCQSSSLYLTIILNTTEIFF